MILIFCIKVVVHACYGAYFVVHVFNHIQAIIIQAGGTHGAPSISPLFVV